MSRIQIYRKFWNWGIVLGWLVWSLVLVDGAWATGAIQLDDSVFVRLNADLDIVVEALPLKGEGLLAMTRRLTGDSEAARAISTLNGRPRRLLSGVRYKVPFDVLNDSYQYKILDALFPADQPRGDGWLHVVEPGAAGRSLWRVAEWFTGDGRNFKSIREHNALVDNSLSPGQQLLIPRAILLPALRAALPAALPNAVTAVGNHQLDYVTDESGEYAIYRLKASEALYSAVVVRFTGRAFAEDVNAYAAELAELNNIPDVTDMAIGQAIRIPLEQVLPQYLPADHPRRIEWQKSRSESEQYSNTVQASRLEGITVILDAGHGGQDPGAMKEGVWESVYVYDIALRTKELLETTTAATVAQTTRDGTNFRLIDRDVLPRSRSHTVLTTPPYKIQDVKTGTHLRWYLANSVYAKAARKNGSEKVVFISIHADSLHSSLRGAMAYIPASSLTKGEFGRSSPVYNARQEVRERPRVRFSWKERVKSEGLSRQLAQSLMTSFRRHGLAVHREQPIRDRIIRNRRSIFVPAVIRFNAVPAKLLFEVCNLNNPQDRRLIKTREFRQKVAEALVDGILEYYGQSPASEPAARVAK